MISAGNLAVQWEYRDAASDNEEDYQPVPSDTALFDEAQWTPGVSQSYDFRVTNVGSLTTTWKLIFTNVVASGAANLADALTVTVSDDGGEIAGTGEALSSYMEEGAVETTLATDVAYEFTMTVAFPSGNDDNRYNGASISFDITVLAKQDLEGAEYPEVPVSPDFTADIQSILSAAEAGESVYLPAEAEIDLTETLSVPAGVVVDAQGATITPAENTNAFSVRADDVTIKNANFVGNSGTTDSNKWAIDAQNATNLTIDGCTFSGSSSTMNHAIYAPDSTGLTIRNSTFERPINLGNARNVEIIGNQFNTFMGVCGITISGTVADITITENSIGALSQALIRLYPTTIEEGSTVTVLNNNLTDKSKQFATEGGGDVMALIGNGLITDTLYIDSVEDFAIAVANQEDGQNWFVESNSEPYALSSAISVTKSISIIGDGWSKPVLQFNQSAGIDINASIDSLILDNITLRGINEMGDEVMEHAYMGVGTYNDSGNNGYNVGKFTVTDCVIEGFSYGVYFGAKTRQHNTLNVSMSDTVIQDNLIKGMYFETLSNSAFTNCQILRNGADPEKVHDNFNTWLCGVDINLKYGTYENIDFVDCMFEDNGAALGGALLIKARDDGDYAKDPATLDGVTIDGCTFADSNNGNDIAFGEPDRNNSTPTNVTITNTTAHVTNNTAIEVAGIAAGESKDFVAEASGN